VRIIELLTASVVTVSVAGISYAACSPDEVKARTQAVADQASCQAVDAAIVGYLSVHDQAPTSIADLAGYVKGDISAYRVVDGVAAGPGC